MTKDINNIKFGDYVEIEQKRYSIKNQWYIYKVMGRLESNYYVDVPVQCPGSNTPHDEVVDVVACVCCGVCETEVLKYRLIDVCIWRN